MNYEDNQSRSRNVTAKDIVVACVVLGLLLPLFWFRESGEKWAVYLMAIIPVIGVAYWLDISREKRAQGEKDAKAELDKTALGRGFKYFMWAVYVFAAVVIIKSLAELVLSA